MDTEEDEDEDEGKGKEKLYLSHSWEMYPAAETLILWCPHDT